MIQLALMIAGIALGVILMVLATKEGSPALIAAGAGAFLIGALSGLGSSRLAIASPAQGGAELKGAGQAFLASLPTAGSRLKFR